MKRVFKTTLILGIFMAGVSGIEAQEKNDSAINMMMEDPQTREQVYNAIADDSEMKKEMMQRMMREAKKDSASCNMMGNMMMKDGHMRDMMMEKMMDGASKDDGMGKKMCMMMMEDGKMMQMMDNMKKEKSMAPGKRNDKSTKKGHNSQMHKNN